MSDAPSRNQDAPLSQEAQMLAKAFSDLGDDFIELCRKTGSSRELSLAVTKMEEGVFWALAHVGKALK